MCTTYILYGIMTSNYGAVLPSATVSEFRVLRFYIEQGTLNFKNFEIRTPYVL